MSDPTFWDDRYLANDYIFGTSPNDFLREEASRIPLGKVLCLGEGEGRNAVHLALAGYTVTAVDQSLVGLNKASALAHARGVALLTEVVDVTTYSLGKSQWQGITSIFLHLPPPARRSLHERVGEALAPGGVYLLEGYAKEQVNFGTGGPKAAELLLRLEEVVAELAPLEIIRAEALERPVVEGSAHTGRAAVVQIVARKP